MLNITGEVGGYMGLLIGGSVLTLLEVIDLFIYNMFTKLMDRHKQRKKVVDVNHSTSPPPMHTLKT